VPLVPAAAAFGASFGVLARTAAVGWLPATVMSATTFAGSAQVAAVSILGAGGGLGAAIAAAVLLNTRYGAISISIGSRFTGPLWRRLAESQLVVDESWALSLREDGQIERRVLLGAGATLWIFWTSGTLAGGIVGTALGDPKTLGLDGAFGALFLALLSPHVRRRRAMAAAIGGAAIAFALVPVAPAGVPILAATAACVVGWSRS
jgi:4-azaleucine resistance transporter AzlC